MLHKVFEIGYRTSWEWKVDRWARSYEFKDGISWSWKAKDTRTWYCLVRADLNCANNTDSISTPEYEGLRLSMFCDGQDDIDSYL